MSFCPLCGHGQGNGGDPCARCERAEMEAEREAERSPFLQEGVEVDMPLGVVDAPNVAVRSQKSK